MIANDIIAALGLAEQTDYTAQKLGSLHVLNQYIRRLPFPDWAALHDDHIRPLTPYFPAVDEDLAEIAACPQLAPGYLAQLDSHHFHAFLAHAAYWADPPAEWTLEQVNHITRQDEKSLSTKI
jgi:hypothetical protein